MTFDDMMEQALDMLRRRGRVSYRALKRQFTVDDDYLADLKAEILYTQSEVVEDGDRGLVWTGALTEPSRPAQDGTDAESSPHETLPSRPESLPIDIQSSEAERRQLTVMFCDVVESTTLSEQLDPEDLRELMRSYQATCSEVIQRYEGYVAQLLGDGLLVYFGYPQAHEDDAQRAVRTGLEIVDAIRHLNSHLKPVQDVKLAVRLGIHTGLVVVGEMGVEGRQEHLALGATPNIAARLQGLARPDNVVVSEPTYRLVHGYFDCHDLGAQDLKGIAEPIAVYEIIRESGAQSRLQIASARGFTPLVGRDAEMTLLLERWEQVKEGQGQVVMLSGEAGIGKPQPEYYPSRS